MLSIIEQETQDGGCEDSLIEITDVKPLRKKEVTGTIDYFTGQ